MYRSSLLLLLSVLFVAVPAGSRAQDAPVVLVAHGGAGSITRDGLSAELEQAHRAKLEEALRSGFAILEDGGSSMDAVVQTIRTLEASPLFNAGVGAVLTSEGTVELDASLMEGSSHRSGAVAGVKHVASPIALARLVMEESPHVMMVGEGAEAFAQEHGVPLIENESLRTDEQVRRWERVRAASTGASGALSPALQEEGGLEGGKLGTVGAVARDATGTIAAGTSTGGMMNKRWGRVGDSPIVGAGTYADDMTCGVSSTGHGEYFIRGVLAYRVSALMRYGGLGLSEAAGAVIHGTLAEMGGTGGMIALDADGNVAMPFNTPGMFRGYIDADGQVTIRIFTDD